MKTVRTLAEVPGGYDRGVQELLRLLRIKHGVRFVVLEDGPADLEAHPNQEAH